VIANAQAEQLRVLPPPCDRTQSWSAQIGVLSFCRDGRKLLTIGKHLVGELVQVTDDDPLLAYDRSSGRTAVSTGTLAMYGADGKLLAVASGGHHFGDVAIEDEGHVLALDTPTGALWRWTWATDRLDKLVPVQDALAVGATAGGVMISFDDGHVSQLVDGHELRRIELGEHVVFISTSPDRRWAALQLESGATVIVDATTGAIAHRLGGSDTSLVQPYFDDTGELLIRPTNGDTSIWERATGLPLVTSLDLLRAPNSDVVFGDGGALELQGDRSGEIELPRDRRPAAELLADLACHVPLAIVDGRLEPATPRCAP
jgi:hypothetical protein